MLYLQYIRTHPFISPGVTPDEILKQLPPVYLNAGSLDPLFDDAVHIAKRIDKVTSKLKFEVYDGLEHGKPRISMLLIV